MAKRKRLYELTIADDFMFGAVMQDPKKCKPLLELILGVKIRKITYPQLQKVIDKLYESKAIRLDVYVADDKGTVYNVEIQTTSKKSLPKRTRYYQGIIILNTKGTVGEISEEPKDLLHFMDGMAPESEYAKELEKTVDDVKESREWRREYMVMMERMMDAKKIGKWETIVSIVRRKRGIISKDMIAELVDVKPEDVSEIMDLLDAHPDWDDDEIADDIVF